MEKSQFQTMSHQQGIFYVEQAASLLNLRDFAMPTMIVSGTNGKGTVIAALESIYQVAGYRVASFTSPALVNATEQIRLNGLPISEADLQQGFELLDRCLKEKDFDITALTPFEKLTLVALQQCQIWVPQILLLEVGFGGREDAVNVVNADVAVITQIAFDHERYLGNSREAIAWHKSGIFRKDQTIIISEPEPPAILLEEANRLSSQVFLIGRDFRVSPVCEHEVLHPNNLAAVCQVVHALQEKLPVSEECIKEGVKQTYHKNSFYHLSKKPIIILDGAHNAAAVTYLKESLLRHYPKTGFFALFSMFADKPIASTIQTLAPLIDKWFVAEIDSPRAASLEQLKEAFYMSQVEAVEFFENLSQAHQALKQVFLEISQDEYGMLAFGSLDVVGFMLRETNL